MRALVAGAGGFIGGHLVNRLESLGIEVLAIDIKKIEDWFQLPKGAAPISANLSLRENCFSLTENVDLVFNLAADMGGMGFIESNKAKCMESVLINTHLLQAAVKNGISKFFYSSSACVYASWHQNSLEVLPLKEQDAYPADPEDGYGWEKLFSERMCRHFLEDYGLKTRVARYHNVYGPFGTYDGGREKAPAAACRKVYKAIKDKTFSIEIWGDGNQLRSFTYIDDCIDGTILLSNSRVESPINIGSSETISIKSLYETIIVNLGFETEQFQFNYNLTAPQGVRGRSSDNTKCLETLNWTPSISVSSGIMKTYEWICKDIEDNK